MRKILVVVTLFIWALTCQAQETQEKMMNIQKTDGTTAQTRVAELDEISFLTVEEGGQGLIVTSKSGETASVLFMTNPVVTVSSGKLTIKYDSADTMEFEISDIAEIVFGDATDPAGIKDVKGFSYVLQDGGALLRGIPESVVPQVYSIDGRCLPTPSVSNGELQLNRSTLGKGIFIVKVGTFSTKIKL